eukprot:1782075-Rhodomonas_salina.1
MSPPQGQRGLHQAWGSPVLVGQDEAHRHQSLLPATGCSGWSHSFDRMPNDGDDSGYDDQGALGSSAEARVSQG